MRRSGNWIAEHTGVPRHRERSFAFGQMQFRRSGYGAMQLAGPFAGTARLGLLDYIVDSQSEAVQSLDDSWKSWRTGCSTAFRGACRSSDAASSSARAW
jgi:hypothetical protein